MSTPVNPSDPIEPSSFSPGLSGAPGELPPVSFTAQQGSGVDPTGVWTKFLSMGGQPATQAEVKKFIDQLCRTMGQHVQNECQRALKAMRKAKREIEGQ